MHRQWIAIDGNEAAAHIAFKVSEVIAIYPITPSSPMGELSDEWSAKSESNIFGTVPIVQEMQSEGGAAGAIHGALQAGALATTFTSSQGLLLMIPNMFKIAGELTSAVFHIAARSIATHALSIFGDHSDVMSIRSTGWSIIFSSSVQEGVDLALVAHSATLKARIPFVHAFDGFRTSHEVMKVSMVSDDDIREMIDPDAVAAHRSRALSPDHPIIRGTAQNPDVFFQAREASNPYYMATPEIVQETMDHLARLTGRVYHLFDYVGAPDAEEVVVAMGSGCKTVESVVRHLNAEGRKVGLVIVRLYRPFSKDHLLKALPKSVRSIAVLDRTKEPGATGEPLYQDVVTALTENFLENRTGMETLPRVIGGRYGLSSKEFTPAMVLAVFDELLKTLPKNHFTIGIHDDVTFTSLDYDPAFTLEPPGSVRCVFWGLGADGTVGANKNSIKIIAEDTENHAQGYFVYDSKKSGARTVSHLRFGPNPVEGPFLIQRAGFIAVHQFTFLERYDVLENAEEGTILLLNSPYPVDTVWDKIPREVQQKIIDLRMKLYVIDGYKVAAEAGMGTRINTVMQTCFFAISGVLPRETAIEKIKETIRKTYWKRGDVVVQKNFNAVDSALAHLYEVTVPEKATGLPTLTILVPNDAPDFIRNVTAPMIAGKGDNLPVSSLPIDGTFPVGTTKYEKRNIAQEVPVWDVDLCIQCGKCVLVCPHAAIRAAVYTPERLTASPEKFKSATARWREMGDKSYTLQVAVEDCTGCELCVEICPVKDKQNPERRALNMEPQLPLRESERVNWDFFLTLDEHLPASVAPSNVKNVQLRQPLFEFSGACTGCGEAPYVRLMSQLFGDRSVVANATGCSSIYGGNLPTAPWTTNSDGRGPAWSNSLFEDNAEFGLGMRLAIDKQSGYARELVTRLRSDIGDRLADAILNASQKTEVEIDMQRQRVEQLRSTIDTLPETRETVDLWRLADMLVQKSVWILGGDGWAYDIGFGGVDHVLASGRNVNLLVLDTEVYSNTGGQASKATPLGASAKFAFSGKPTPKKDLGMYAMTIGSVYVAQIAVGSNDAQTVKAFIEAEAYDGPSLIIAYSPCIVHGFDISHGLDQQKLAVDSGYWPLYRFNPERRKMGQNPLQIDSKEPRISFQEYAYTESRYKMLQQADPEHAAALMEAAQNAVNQKWERLVALATP